MWKLTIEDDQGNRIPVPLVRDDYSIGRAVENTLRLTERNVSRNHASLRQEGERWMLQDLGSYNGSYVNGERVVASQELSHGDLIQLGDYRIEVLEEAEAPVATEAPPAEPTEAEIPAFAEAKVGMLVDEEPPPPPAPEAPIPNDLVASAIAAAAANEPDEDVDFVPGLTRKPRKGNGLLVGLVAAVAVGGLAFALLRPDSSPTVEVESVKPPAQLAAVPVPAVREGKSQAEEAVAEVEKAAAEVLDIDEPKVEPAQVLEVAKTEPEPKPAQEKALVAPARVAVAPTQDKSAPPRAAAPAKAPTERRPVLAANPFDTPGETKAPAAAPPQTKATNAKPPAGGKSLADLAAEGREGEAKMRPILEQRIARGTASPSDIKLLRAICRNMGDRVCADRMTALLAQQN